MSMQEVLDNPSRRVFHIAQECYIIFGGTDTTDKEFFIRFGNYPDIPALVLQKTAAIACTATPLGDIFFELAHGTERAQSVFMGLPRVIRKYKALFGYATIQAIKYESVVGDKPEQGVYIHYTGEEELDVRINNKPFFSLGARVKQDRHYQTVVSNAYNVVRKMRAAYGSKQLAEHGFYMLGNSAYVYNKQTAMAINPDPNFVMVHATRGFDPIAVQSAYFSDARSLALYRLLVHARTHRLNGAILVNQNTDLDMVQRICNFVGYPYKQMAAPHQKIPFQELAIGLSQNQKSIKIVGPYNIKVIIDTDKKRWKAHSGRDSGGDMLYDGLLYGWDLSRKHSWNELRSKFLPQSFDVGTHNIPSHEREFLMNGLSVIDDTSRRLLKSALRRIKRLQRKCTKHPSRFFVFALANINHIASLALVNQSKDDGIYALLKKAVSIFKSTYHAVRSSAPKQHAGTGISIFPDMSALIVNTDDGIRCFVDYQWNRSVNYAQHDEALCREIADFALVRDADYYADELNRLYELFASLDGKRRGSHVGLRSEKSDELAGADGATDADGDARPDGEGERTRKRAGRSYKGRRRLRRFAVIVAIVILLVGTLFGLDFFGVLNIGDTIGRLSQATDGVVNRFGDRDEGRATNRREQEGGQLSQQDSEQLEQRNNDGGDGVDDAELSSDIDIDVLRSAVADGTNLNSPWIILSTPFGAVNITVGEIITTTNLIAVNSGFRPLGDDSGDGPDPDLIYPQGILRLPPDTAQYNIVLNDTMWGVAENLIIEQVKDHIGTLAIINRQLNDDANNIDVAAVRLSIEEIIAQSYCADVIAIATSLLNRL